MMQREELVNQLNELAGWFDEIAVGTTIACTSELNTRRAKMWRERARKLDNTRCETCYFWQEDPARDHEKLRACVSLNCLTRKTSGCFGWKEKK